MKNFLSLIAIAAAALAPFYSQFATGPTACSCAPCDCLVCDSPATPADLVTTSSAPAADLVALTAGGQVSQIAEIKFETPQPSPAAIDVGDGSLNRPTHTESKPAAADPPPGLILPVSNHTPAAASKAATVAGRWELRSYGRRGQFTQWVWNSNPTTAAASPSPVAACRFGSCSSCR